MFSFSFLRRRENDLLYVVSPCGLFSVYAIEKKLSVLLLWIGDFGPTQPNNYLKGVVLRIGRKECDSR